MARARSSSLILSSAVSPRLALDIEFFQDGQKALESGVDLLSDRSVPLGTRIGERRILLQDETGILGLGTDIVQPDRVEIAEELENLLPKALLSSSLRQDEKSLELVLRALVSPFCEELADDKPGRREGSASAEQPNRRRWYTKNSGKISKDHDAQSLGASDVVSLSGLSVPEQIEDVTRRTDERRSPFLMLKALAAEGFNDLSTSLGDRGLGNRDVDVLRQRRHVCREPEEP
jgi:hypothetical protein